MPRITITITDKVDGHVEILCTPPMDEILSEIAQKDGRNVAPSKIYATRMITAGMKLGQEARGDKSKIITTLPGRPRRG